MVAYGSCVFPALGPHHILIVDLVGALPCPRDLAYDRLNTRSVSCLLRGSFNDDHPHAAASHLTCRGASRMGKAGVLDSSPISPDKIRSFPTNSTTAIPSVFAAFHRVTITQSGSCYVVNEWLHISRRRKI